VLESKVLRKVFKFKTFLTDEFILLLFIIRSQGSSVSIVTTLRAEGPGFDSRQGKLHLFCYRVQIASGVHPAS